MRKTRKKSDAMRLLKKLAGGPLTLSRAIESVRKSEGLSQDECAKKLRTASSRNSFSRSARARFRSTGSKRNTRTSASAVSSSINTPVTTRSPSPASARGRDVSHTRAARFSRIASTPKWEALDLIGEIYVVEREAKEAGVVGTDAHLALRKARSRPLFAKLLRWGRRHRHSFEPRSGIAKAIRYLLRNFRALGCFLRYATIPPDNNPAEAGLRRVALGRSNYLFVGHKESGHDHAVLNTLVASCEKNGVNAIAYLTDVLTRVQTHRASKIHELLPHRWKPPDPAASAAPVATT